MNDGIKCGIVGVGIVVFCTVTGGTLGGLFLKKESVAFQQTIGGALVPTQHVTAQNSIVSPAASGVVNDFKTPVVVAPLPKPIIFLKTSDLFSERHFGDQMLEVQNRFRDAVQTPMVKQK